jgi:thymidylate kinase
MPVIAHRRTSRRRAVSIVSFSGIDGAGKSTQISLLEDWLRKSGQRTGLLSLWDDVVVCSHGREFMSNKAFKGDRGIGSPDKPLHRRDKNVNSLPVTMARCLLYFADALSLRRRIAKAGASDCDVVIFDRYIYDELANLPLQRLAARVFAWIVLRITPVPTLALVIDAAHDEAHARKPEYPLDFVERNRQAYFAIADLAGHITVIPPGSITAVESRIRHEVSLRLPRTGGDLPPMIHSAANISSPELIES